MNEAIAFAPLTTLGTKLRSGELTSTELTRFFLERLERLGPRYHCVVTLTRDLALDQAATADAELKAGKDRGPLHGIPYGAKDLLATRGIPTTWGAAPFKGRVIDRDAAVIARLREAGAVLAAKLSMVELAGGMGYRQPNASLTGAGLNPWNPETWSGGSSSGSGSAVAAGLVPFAIGTETWGSITCPCSFCGITGLRPTYGRVPLAGAMALAWTHDKIGPMAHDVHDCGLVLDAIAGPDDEDPSAAERPYRYPAADEPGRPFRLAVLQDGVKDAHPDVRERFDAALEVFRRQGATVDEVTVPDLPYELVAVTIISAEGGAAFEELVLSGEVAELTAPEDRLGGYADHAILATEYLRAQRIRAKLARELDRFFAPYDAVLTPAQAEGAPPAEGTFPHEHSHKSMGGPGNVCGTPAIVVPMGRTRDGLPVGLQLDGRAYSENRLLAVALAYQRETAWHREHPEIS